ncbi:MAG: hypothetical protein N5P05_002952 [Chroococcopsis gigantea SAG 12.99]|nr:hypothetical protein [Chroococcopsis gigantea SAG 12.99]
MLYLAEVKKQVKGFMGGLKTEIKLLACQHNDQTWSAVTTEELISYDENKSLGEGTLLLVKLGNNRQIQGNADFAGLEMVRQLQKISRLMEKNKEDQEKIEQWKQSLTYQSEILNRQKMDIEAQAEHFEQQSSELEQQYSYLKQQREELESLQKQLEFQQRQLEQQEVNLGSTGDLSPEQAQWIQGVIERFSQTTNGIEPITRPFLVAKESVNGQQSLLNGHWQKLNQQKGQLNQQQELVERLTRSISERRQEIYIAKNSLEQAKTQLYVQEAVLNNKKELLGRVNLTLQTTEELRQNITKIARGDQIDTEPKVDVENLENMPLQELETIVNNLQKELDRLMTFVDEQEEELSYKSQEVEELRNKYNSASDYDRLTLESDLAEAMEGKKMLDQTLIGQRRNISERQAVLEGHLKVFKRRNGLMEINSRDQINLQPLIIMLAERQQSTEGERQLLEREIEHLQSSLRQIREILGEQSAEHEQQVKELEAKEQEWQQANSNLATLRAQVQLYESSLQPIQDRLDEIRRLLDDLSPWLTDANANNNSYPFSASA